MRSRLDEIKLASGWEWVGVVLLQKRGTTDLKVKVGLLEKRTRHGLVPRLLALGPDLSPIGRLHHLSMFLLNDGGWGSRGGGLRRGRRLSLASRNGECSSGCSQLACKATGSLQSGGRQHGCGRSLSRKTEKLLVGCVEVDRMSNDQLPPANSRQNMHSGLSLRRPWQSQVMMQGRVPL